MDQLELALRSPADALCRATSDPGAYGWRMAWLGTLTDLADED